MKYVVVVGDGMADRPLASLGWKTPLEVADKPNMDSIAARGRSGLLRTLSNDMPLGSDVANLSILGYDPHKHYSGGRGPLEAASQGIRLRDDDIAIRCNLVSEEDGILKDYSGGHITNEEAKVLIEAVAERFGGRDIVFYPGVGYRNLLILKGAGYSTDVLLTPPHDIVGRKIEGNLPKPTSKKGEETAKLLEKIMLESKEILAKHPVNINRRREGKSEANMLWFWGAGRRLKLQSFRKRFGLSGALISAVDLLRGIAVYIGLEVIDVQGATGYYDTNYEGKAEAALAALNRKDFVYVHVEAPDEAGHEGDAKKKIKAIEDLDKRLIGRILNSLSGEEFKIAVLSDHMTPIEVRTHTLDPVPFSIYSTCGGTDSVERYDEASAAKGFFGIREATEFMKILLEA